MIEVTLNEGQKKNKKTGHFDTYFFSSKYVKIIKVPLKVLSDRMKHNRKDILFNSSTLRYKMEIDCCFKVVWNTDMLIIM